MDHITATSWSCRVLLYTHLTMYSTQLLIQAIVISHFRLLQLPP
uniref:Uncharacterized protein n=1 Tax=Anguilla anguilla TaxID=7936 RepID=A0A0E9URE3_ANGAN